jgi:hypothetical protein
MEARAGKRRRAVDPQQHEKKRLIGNFKKNKRQRTAASIPLRP